MEYRCGYFAAAYVFYNDDLTNGQRDTQGEDSQRTLLGRIEQWNDAAAEYRDWNFPGTSALTG